MKIYDEDEIETLYDEAKKIVINAQKGQTSMIQRKLRLGYAKSALLMDMLEERGVVGLPDLSGPMGKPREILAPYKK